MAKRSREASVRLDSFLDIMTCLVGVLVLIILLTGIDAAQIQVLIPTPLGHAADLRQIIIECRNDMLYLVPLDDIRQHAVKALDEISEEAAGDMVKVMQLLAERRVRVGDYEVDLAQAMSGHLILVPVPGEEGYALRSIETETAGKWFGRILARIDTKEEMLTFLVRDDSYTVFKRARALAWQKKIEVAYELLDARDVIRFGPGGELTLAQ